MSTQTEAIEKPGRIALFYGRHQLTIVRTEVIIVFLALIRTLTSYYEVKTGPGNTLPAHQVGPIITGSLVAAVCCLLLAILYSVRKYQIMNVVFVLTIASLVLVKILLF